MAGIIGIPGRLQSVQAAAFARNPRSTSSECADLITLTKLVAEVDLRPQLVSLPPPSHVLLEILEWLLGRWLG